ncbi:MAG TPA: PqqD family protein, partial [Kiloniellales bacterium]|nr:PqqD family protein [Kiloniellales bacterium]
LDGGAAALWPSLLAGTSREALLREAEAAFDAPAHVVRPAVEAFLAELLAEGVVVRSEGAVIARAPSGKQPFEPPRMKRYDDLEELMGVGED